MKGYFSQLARHSGLGFTPHRAGGGSHLEPAVATQANASNAADALEINEVTFAESSPVRDPDVTAVDSGSGAHKPAAREISPVPPHEIPARAHQIPTGQLIEDARPKQTEPDLPRQADTVTPTRIALTGSPEETRIEFASPQPEGRAPQAPSVTADSSSVEPPPAQIPENLASNNLGLNIAPQDSIERDERLEVEQPEIAAVELVYLEEPSPGRVSMPVNTGEQSDTHPVRPLEPKLIARDQFREVMAWVSAPPEEVESMTTLSGAMKTPTQTYDDVITTEREPDELSSRELIRLKEPEVQDLSLSIGSISIVIEEPKQDVQLFPTPAMAENRSSERDAPEPTRLSRYYLRNW